VITYLGTRIGLLVVAISLVSICELVVVLALGVHRSFWTAIGTALVLVLPLRLGIAPPALKAKMARWWKWHTSWADAHPFQGAAADGLSIFLFASAWSLTFESPSDLTIGTAAGCGVMVASFSGIVAVVERWRARQG
jgi:hypothetical protein